MKKSIIVALIAIAVVTVVVALFFTAYGIGLNSAETDATAEIEAMKESLLNDAKTSGANAGAAYRATVEKVIADLRTKIDNIGTGGESSEVDTSELEALLDELDQDLADTAGGIKELSGSNLEMLSSLRTTLTDLKSSHQSEITTYGNEKRKIQSAMNGLTGVDLSGFEAALAFIDLAIQNNQRAIAELDGQIAEVNGLIAELNG